MGSVERTEPSTTAVLIIDVQERLAPAMPPEQLAQLLRAAKIMLGAAAELGAPVLVTEQYPQGLGRTVPELQQLLGAVDHHLVDKLTFSCCGEPRLGQLLQAAQVKAVVVLGMETHVCVFQTVRDLVAQGRRVDVLSDGVASRREDHRQAGLRLCEQAGATLTTAETVLFDWLIRSGTDTFRKLSKLVR